MATERRPAEMIKARKTRPNLPIVSAVRRILLRKLRLPFHNPASIFGNLEGFEEKVP
jgi:hypothetical protein